MGVDGQPNPRERYVVSHTYRAIPASVRRAREAVTDLAERQGASSEILDDIRLAVSEAATNVVTHAYAEQTGGSFRLLAVAGGGEIIVVIDDDGRGLDAETDRPGLGMGLQVMQQVARRAIFRTRSSGGSTVQLSFSLDRRPSVAVPA